MKKFFALLAIISIVLTTQAQKSGDVGIYAGGAYYLGDINTHKQFYNTSLAYGALFRYNLNMRYSLRASVTSTKLSGSDSDFSNGYQQLRNHAFESSITDITAMFEFNFFDYTTSTDKHPFTPYITAGFTVFASNAIPGSIKMALPAGIGLKLRISRRWSCGLDWTVRRTFTDDLDQISAESAMKFGGSYPEKQLSYTSSADWYSFAGFFLTFSLYELKGRCPAYF